MATFTYTKERLTAARYRRGPGWQGAAYDSKLETNGVANAVLTLTLKIRFVDLDPTFYGKTVKDGDGEEFGIRKWEPGELMHYKSQALDQANTTWNKQLCLVPPHDFDLFDAPSGAPAVRPNVVCALNVVEAGVSSEHVTVQLARLKYQRDSPHFWPAPRRDNGSFRSNALLWDNFDTGARTDEAEANGEDIIHWTVPHEVGHLLGMGHIGGALLMRSCIDARKANPKEEGASCYGDAKDIPVWMARDIMGVGTVVHACNASPWLAVIEVHTGCPGERWLPAGVILPPRRIADIPATDPTQSNSPYQGGFQGVSDYRSAR